MMNNPSSSRLRRLLLPLLATVSLILLATNASGARYKKNEKKWHQAGYGFKVSGFKYVDNGVEMTLRAPENLSRKIFKANQEVLSPSQKRTYRGRPIDHKVTLTTSGKAVITFDFLHQRAKSWNLSFAPSAIPHNRRDIVKYAAELLNRDLTKKRSGSKPKK